MELEIWEHPGEGKMKAWIPAEEALMPVEEENWKVADRIWEERTRLCCDEEMKEM